MKLRCRFGFHRWLPWSAPAFVTGLQHRLCGDCAIEKYRKPNIPSDSGIETYL